MEQYPVRQKKKMGDIYQSSERLIALVNDLLNLSRIETGKVEFIPSNEQIEEIISEIVKDLSIIAEKKNLYLKIKNPPEKLPKVSVDREKIRQVILNIIDNALKYTNKGGVTVEIRSEEMRKGNESILINITDTGEGMTKEESSNMFQSFSRGTAGNLLHREGAGLGLYVSKKFVEMHNGKIWVISNGKGKGTTFFIEIPTKKGRYNMEKDKK